MYNLRQFKPTLYLVLLMGVSGFALAAEAPGLWVMAVAGILVNAYLVKTGRFHPMPRVVANLVTIVALLFVLFEMRSGSATPIITIGEFLVLLHLVKLYEQRANRDYAQLLVLSLLLMVAGAINTYSLLFALLFFGYLFASLYCCLLFHLKVEADQAQLAIGLSEAIAGSGATTQDQRNLSRSMRKVTGLVAAVSVATAVLVFLFFPRGAGAGLLGPLQFRPSQTLTGFSEEVGYQDIARITKNEAIVARVTVSKNGAPLKGSEPVLLRGLALDRYTGSNADRTEGGPWQWVRSVAQRRNKFTGRLGYWPNDSVNIPAEQTAILDKSAFDAMARGQAMDQYVQDIHLDPLGETAIFAMPGVVQITPQSELHLRYTHEDRVMQSMEPLTRAIDYAVVSTGTTPLISAAAAPGDTSLDHQRFLANLRINQQRPYGSQIDPQIIAFAHKPEVCGVDAATGKPLADLLPANWASRGPADFAVEEKIAANFEKYLRTNFTYTLDLTDLASVEGRDPMVVFLYDFKSGHCQFFAGAMTLLCQSLYIPARVVIGFRTDEFNGVGGYYVVRQSHAHAWVEVLTRNGWASFDPTSGREVASSRHDGALSGIKHLFDYLDYRWANSVVAYGSSDRENLIEHLNFWMTRQAVGGSETLSGARRHLGSWWDHEAVGIPSQVIGALILIMVAAIVATIGWFLWERLRLTRRARHIGLGALSVSDQARLARQLGFYDDLLRLLEKRDIHRPPQLTHLEFSRTLAFLPSEIYEDIHRLTRVFYKIRFGLSELSPGSRRHLSAVIARIESALPHPGK